MNIKLYKSHHFEMAAQKSYENPIKFMIIFNIIRTFLSVHD